MKIAFIASPKQAAQEALHHLTLRYGQCGVSDADYVVALGGDGTALRALHAVMAAGRQPVYAMRVAGALGFLANPFVLENLPERLSIARRLTFRPLKAEVEYEAGSATVFAVNEIVLLRQRLQVAKLRVKVETERFAPLIGDGLLVATPIGSSGYNRSAGGARLPSDSSLLALTALAPHHRSDWCNSVVGDDADIDIEVIDPEHRPVGLQTSMLELAKLRHARISSSRDLPLTLLFDPGGGTPITWTPEQSLYGGSPAFACWRAAPHQIGLEPGDGMRDHRLQRSRLGEQMRCARNNLQRLWGPPRRAWACSFSSITP